MIKRKIIAFLLVMMPLCLFLSVCSRARRDERMSDEARSQKNFQPSSLDAILKKVASYEYGQNEEILSQLRDYVWAIRNSPESSQLCEERLAEFLKSKATLAAKMAVCRQLRMIGTSVSVPVLEEMLLREETSDMARYALEKIPGASADRALIEGLRKSEGKVKIGIISSLGGREVQDCVPILGELIYDPDASIGISATKALGQIANPDAALLLSNALEKTKGKIQIEVAASLLRCAEKYLANKDLKSSADIYARLLTLELPTPIRQAAMKGMIASSGNSARKLVVDVLTGKEKELYAPAISMIEDIFDGSTIQELRALLPNLPPENQVQLLAVMAHYRDKAILSTAIEATKSEESDVRVAGLKALQTLGDASTVELLTFHAAKAEGEEKTVARNSLWGIPGSDVDQVILQSLVKDPDPDIQNELMMSIGERRIYAGKEHLFEKAGSSNSKIRLQAIKTLKEIAAPSDLTRLVHLLLERTDETEQEEIKSTIWATARKISNPIGRADAVKAMLPSVQDIKGRCALYRVLGMIGDDSSLPLIRTALAEENEQTHDAAVRALADWPTITPRDDLVKIARTSSNPVHQVLALRAYLRMVEMDEYLSPEDAIRTLKKALAIAKRAEEKKTILSILTGFACKDALRLAKSMTKDKEVKAEAKLAVEKIKAKLEKKPR